MPLESLNVPNPHHFSSFRRRAAYAFTHSNGDAGRAPLERADNEFAILQKVETHPVHVCQGVKQKRGENRCVGYEILLPTETLPKRQDVAS